MSIRSVTHLAGRLCGVLLCCGIAMSAAAAPAHADTGQQAPARSFIWIQDPWSGETALTSFAEPDQSLWDATQIKDYQQALKAEYPPPLGLLVISDLNIEVPIYNGTEEHILDRGAGRIKGMAKMNEDGNLGISAHRDSFFRGLKDIELGDVVLVQSAQGVEKYAVSLNLGMIGALLVALASYNISLAAERKLYSCKEAD